MPSDEEIRKSGFEPEDYADDFLEVWPECWPAIRLFIRLRTQWRATQGGFIGLDYAAAYPLIDRATTTPAEWDDLLDDIQVMERAALLVMNSQA